MKDASEHRSKLHIDEDRVAIPVPEIVSLVSDIFLSLGCSSAIAKEVATHLADANLCGMESDTGPVKKAGQRFVICRQIAS
jgi:predicted RNA methylase